MLASMRLCSALILLCGTLPVRAQSPQEALSSPPVATRPLRRAEVAAKRAEIREQLFIPETLPALEPHRWSTFSPTPGVLADRIAYSTAAGMLVPAVVYRPDPAVAPYTGKLPGLVIVNGHGSDKFGWYAFYSGMMFARAGAVVVTYDMIGEGERNARRRSRENPSPHDKDVNPPAPLPHDDWGRRLAELMQVDLMQAVSYLRAQPEVDPKRIGVLGYSMGSFVAGIEGAYDTRVHAVLLSAGGTFDGPGEYFDSGKLPCQAPPYRSLAVLGDRGAVLFALNASRGPTLVMNGAADKVMNIPAHNQAWFAALRRRTIALHGSEKNVFTTMFFPGIDHRTSWVTPAGVRWLNQQLHFAFWNTDEKISAQGTTHISTWIKANHVDISPNYLREDREGGLDAVGEGLPAIPRSDLSVLPEPEWDALNARLTYVGWATKTMAAEEAAAHAGTRAAQ